MKNKKKSDSNIAETIDISELSVHRSRRKKWFLLTSLILLIAVLLIFLSNGKKSSSIQFKTETVKRGDITVIVTATGTLEPTNEVDVGSEVSGTIESVDVDFNDKVKVGQLLAKIDTTKLQAQVTQSRAALEAAEASVLQAEATVKETRSKLDQYEKVRQLSDNKVPSQLEFDAQQASYERAKADYASAKAAVSQAQATLEANQTDLSKAVIHSPINGIVLTREIEQGQTVAASFETPVLFTLAEDLTKMELHVNIDEADIGQIQDGQKALFNVDAYPDRSFDAQIIQIRYGAETVDGVVTYETVLRVDNTEQLLRPGMTATADIIVMQVQDVITVSNSALRFKMPENTSQDSGGIVNAILPHPPQHESGQKESEINRNSQQQLWVLKDGQPVDFTLFLP